MHSRKYGATRQWRTQEFFSGVVYSRNCFRGGGGGFKKLSCGESEFGSWGGSLLVRGSTQSEMNETRILITLLRMYISGNWDFGSALANLRNFGREWGPPPPPQPPSSVRPCTETPHLRVESEMDTLHVGDFISLTKRYVLQRRPVGHG
jgi:hypothetical protein